MNMWLSQLLHEASAQYQNHYYCRCRCATYAWAIKPNASLGRTQIACRGTRGLQHCITNRIFHTSYHVQNSFRTIEVIFYSSRWFFFAKIFQTTAHASLIRFQTVFPSLSTNSYAYALTLAPYTSQKRNQGRPIFAKNLHCPWRYAKYSIYYIRISWN